MRPEKLHKLLKHVWQHSAFYRDYYGSHGIREADLGEVEIRDLPFLTKQVLMENFNEAVCDARLRKEELERWIQNDLDPRHDFQRDFVVINSSGSSGNIGVFVYNQTAWRIANTALATRLPPPENYSAGKTRVAVYLASHGHFAAVSTSVRLPSSIYDLQILSVLDSSKNIISQLNAFQPHRLGGYASTVSMLADAALSGSLHIQPQRIFLSGDKLTTAMERKIQAAWNAPIYIFYGTSESAFLAVKKPDEKDMAVLDELNVIEVLDKENRSVMPGCEGRVLLTNLYNYTLPILRYELEDDVEVGSTDSDLHVSTIREIRGRGTDALPVILDDGTHDKISHHVLGEFYISGVEKVQFVARRNGGIELCYVASQNLDASVEKEFQRILRMKGAANAAFEIRRVDRIANDPRTGKFSVVRIESGRYRDAIEAPLTSLTTANVSASHSISPNESVQESISARFERQVVASPERLAVKSKRFELTYAALNALANRIARAILARCGEGQAPVALLLGDDAPKIAAMLGALKAGKFYVPLDPAFPAAVLDSIINNSNPVAVVCDGPSLSAHGAEIRGMPVVNVDELPSDRVDENPHVNVSPDHLAYILYTSGSTGAPKGIFQNHRNVLHKVANYTKNSRLSADDRLSLIVSMGFSAAVPNIFAALLSGAALFPFDPKVEGLTNLSRWLREEKITIYQSAVTLFRYLADSLTEEKDFPNVRLVDLFGEAVTAADVERCRKRFSNGCVLRNRLASTETGDVCQYMLRADAPLIEGVVPVGYPVDGVKVSLLDDDGKEVEQGAAGEIAVRSSFLALGYWRDPELTAKKFLAAPEAGADRIYLTGDLGRMLPDGCLIHLGRKDARLKIRGNRIEVAEIEMALLQHPAVKEAVVVGQDDERGEKRLIAYVVPNAGGAAPSTALRIFLEAKLPSYMMPAAFAQLDALPMNANGKVDRQGLAIANATSRTLDENFVAPENELEGTIAGIWREVLRIEKVGIQDNFFDLGGNSLLLIEAHAKLSGISSKTFSVTDLFEYPTIHSLAGFLRGAAEDGAAASGRESGVELRAGRDRLRKQADARREKA